ncbi:MAG: hypothetical protein LC772_00395 [Chloroflexi bacterium]|nr:hypothetical protein [Chloroflexota bacterium]
MIELIKSASPNVATDPDFHYGPKDIKEVQDKAISALEGLLQSENEEGDLLAGADILPGSKCYILDHDGRVYPASALHEVGYCQERIKAGQPVKVIMKVE